MTSRAWLAALCLLAASSCSEDANLVASESEDVVEVAQESLDPPPVAPPADELVDLLHAVDAVVSVSSKVANAKDFPEHLVDGKPETAWNSRTGDLKGWIAFRVPEQSLVTRVEITAGFDKGDAFERNHRITRLRVSREGVVLADTTLDPDERALQGVDLQADGGDFLVEVLDTRPGTEKKWRELAVSEFRVLGFARGAPRTPRSSPRMAIGGLDGVTKSATDDPRRPRGPFSSLDALCTAWTAAVDPDVQAAFDRGWIRDRHVAPHCVRSSDTIGAPVSTIARGPFEEAAWVYLADATEGGTRLVLRTAQGWSITGVELDGRHYDDPGCGHVGLDHLEDAELVRTDGGRDVVVLRTLESDMHWGLGADVPNLSGIVESAFACDVDAEGVASCQGPLEVGRYWGWPEGWDNIEGRYPTPNPGKVRWNKRMMPVLGPAGDLRAVSP